MGLDRPDRWYKIPSIGTAHSAHSLKKPIKYFIYLKHLSLAMPADVLGMHLHA